MIQLGSMEVKFSWNLIRALYLKLIRINKSENEKIFLLVTFLSLAITGSSQNSIKDLDFFIGNWQGIETGVAGNGIGFRTYEYELGDNYIFVKNQSTFPRSEKKPLGEVHRDIGIFSYNSNNSKIVFRSFNVEGYTNIYEIDTAQTTKDRFVFITREIENNPGKWKAKLIFNIDSDTQFTEEFLIAMDGVNFRPFLKNVWTKVK